MDFAVRIVRFCRYLQEEKHEFVISRQILRSGTSIGANVRESQNAQSSKDFVSKMMIALKEADETHYWLEVLMLSDYISPQEYQSLVDDDNELIALLTSIVKSVKSNNKKDKVNRG